jgi:hypothetical protein
MARARLPKARVGASDGKCDKWELQNLFPTGVASFAGIVPSKAFILFLSIAHDRRRNASSLRQSVYGS